MVGFRQREGCNTKRTKHTKDTKLTNSVFHFYKPNSQLLVAAPILQWWHELRALRGLRALRVTTYCLCGRARIYEFELLGHP
jgi:hypothetical protein